MKRILTSLVLVASVYSFAQVSISGEADDTPQATLDVKAIGGKTNGILVPRVSRKVADNMAKPTDKSGGTESAIIESTLIYINDISGEDPNNYATNVDANGFYYFKDGKWVKLGGESATQNWEQIRYGNNGKFLADSEDASIPETAWLVIVSETIKRVKLPQMTPNKEVGRMIIIHKMGKGNTEVRDFSGKTPSNSGTQVSGVNTVLANRGRTFIWDGDFWITTNY